MSIDNVPDVPKMSVKERQQAVAFLMNPWVKIDADTALAFRFLNREIIKLWHMVQQQQENEERLRRKGEPYL